MKSSESIGKLAAALSKAQGEFGAVAKSGQNTYDRYTYADLNDVISTARAGLSAHGLAIATTVEDIANLEPRRTQKGGVSYVVQVKLTVRLMHTSGEWIEGAAYGEGQDRGDKAVYKAITGARKYAVSAMLGLATSDDPEADNRPATPQKSAQAPRRPAPQPSRQQSQPPPQRDTGGPPASEKQRGFLQKLANTRDGKLKADLVDALGNPELTVGMASELIDRATKEKAARANAEKSAGKHTERTHEPPPPSDDDLPF